MVMVDDIVAALKASGYATIPDAISDAAGRGGRAGSSRRSWRTPRLGRDDFEGRNTRRVYALFAKTRALDAMATHPVVLGVLDEVLGHYQLSAPAAIAIGPGEVAQPLHPDDAIYPVPRPHQELVVNVMWPLEDFTEANGATRIVPGSHRWIDERPERPPATTTVEMPARTALLYLGSVWHGGWRQPDRAHPTGRRPALRVGLAATRGEPRAGRATRRGAGPSPCACRSCSATTSTRRSSATSTAATPASS